MFILKRVGFSLEKVNLKISDIKKTTMVRSLAALGTSSFPCDLCGQELTKEDGVHKAIVTDRYLKTVAYICLDCRVDPVEEDFKLAMKKRGDDMQNILDSSSSF